MSDYDLLCQRIGKGGVDRLARLGLDLRPTIPSVVSNRATAQLTDDQVDPAQLDNSVRSLTPSRAEQNLGMKRDVEEESLRQLENVRRIACNQLDQDRRALFGQFMTPGHIANFMVSLFQTWPGQISLLEPGAGIGSLAHAFGRRFIEQHSSGTLKITAYEIEASLTQHLSAHLAELAQRSQQIEIEVIQRDFIQEAVFATSFRGRRFSHVILNPPYRKIGSKSEYRKHVRHIGVETGNLYTAFLALSVELTADGGEIVAIIPRSFCNGSYFRPFRRWLLDKVAISQIHVFESRSKAFSDDDVLQENIIIRLVRRGKQGSVIVSSSDDGSFDGYTERCMPFEQIVKPNDSEQFIHIPTYEINGGIGCVTLAELGLGVATGPVVDFRLRKHSLAVPQPGSVPLLYAHHFSGGELQWPREHKKPNALLLNEDTKKWLMPSGWYTVTKRFSAKEERRRIVAYVVDPGKLPYDLYGFENHINVIHANKAGIDEDLARGLALFLNSTPVDQYFRNFSGHTQVNATDLRSMRFPRRGTLMQFGKWAAMRRAIAQSEIDAFIEKFDGDETAAN
jgi:tRNA1(Val) A37 N6-methylase TrmN6